MRVLPLACVLGLTAGTCLGAVYQLPPVSSGWAYEYQGDAAAGTPAPGGPGLDGTWSSANASDDWDGVGRGTGVGQPGGVSVGNGALTIEDTVLENPGFEGSNRNIYFTHSLSQDNILSPDILDTGITLNFRIRLTASSDEMETPNGYGIFAGGKGNIGVRQIGSDGNEGIISFSLVRQVEETSLEDAVDFGTAGLTMNRLNGDAPTSAVNSDSLFGDPTGLNTLVLDPTVYNDIWVTIVANENLPGNGTHRVSIWANGSLTPTVFNVTAGTGDEGSGFDNYIALGTPATAAIGAFDVDFLTYTAGAFAPIPVPEPGTWALGGLGLALLGFARRFRR